MKEKQQVFCLGIGSGGKVTTPSIFDPIQMGRLQLSNRILMAPMTRSRATSEGIHHELTPLYYQQRASAGLIISEAAAISKQGSGYPLIPGIFNEAQENSWKKVIQAVHEKEGKFFIQLMHTGRVGHSSLNPQSHKPWVAPSAIPLSGTVMAADLTQKPAEVPHELTPHEILDVIDQFVRAAERAIRAGADGVELHGGNGYLIDQFIRDSSNQRGDRYGGSVINRLRFLLELTEAVSGAIGSDRLGVRFSPLSSFNDMKDSDPNTTFVTAARELQSFRLAYLHVIEPVTHAPGLTPVLTPGMKSAFQGTFIANGGYRLNSAQAALAHGVADAISFGEPFIANPDLVERMKLGAPWNVADRKTYYSGGARGYIDYPTLHSSVS